MISKLKILLFFGLLFISLSTWSKDVFLLERGDSLFSLKKYTEAIEIYQDLFDRGDASSAMILKMAFIQEGLKNHVQALYFLQKYYQLTSDKSVLYKMEELAIEQSLSGYTVGDFHFFLTTLNQFRVKIQLALFVTSFVLVIIIFYSGRKGRIPIGLPVIQVIVLTGLLWISNDWEKSSQAIVKEGTVLMRGPSAAAEIRERIIPGHLVQILEETDVWFRILWKDEEAYVRKNKLLKL